MKHSQLTFVVVGSKDRQLEELLRDSGANVSSQPASALTSLMQAGSTPPDALIFDMRPQAAMPGALAALKRHHPDMGVIVVASQLDPPLMLEAMRAGVTEWIAEPVTGPALTEALQRVVAHHLPKAAAGPVFAFVGAKGGVGTTTVAVNVASALCAAPKSDTLLVDLHPAHGDAALFLGAEPRFSTVDVLHNIQRLDEAFLKGLVIATKSGVHLLASADRVPAVPSEARDVRKMIEFVAQRYAYVVLDVPRSELVMLDSLDVTTSIIVVANQELATVRRAATLTAGLRQRYGQDRVDVVINRYDRNADIGRDDVERVTGGRVRHLIPSDYPRALEGLNKGQPVVTQKHHQLAGAFSSLARQLAGAQAPQPSKEERPLGLLGRFGMARA